MPYNDMDPPEYRWWISTAARIEAKQHLSPMTRQALKKILRRTADRTQSWGFVPCLALDLQDEAWSIDHQDDIKRFKYSSIADRKVADYACWILSLGVRDQHNQPSLTQRVVMYEELGRRSFRSLEISTILLLIGDDKYHIDRYRAVDALGKSARDGCEPAFKLLMQIASDREDLGGPVAAFAIADDAIFNRQARAQLLSSVKRAVGIVRRVGIQAMGTIADPRWEMQEQGYAQDVLLEIATNETDPDRDAAFEVLGPLAADSRRSDVLELLLAVGSESGNRWLNDALEALKWAASA